MSRELLFVLIMINGLFSIGCIGLAFVSGWREFWWLILGIISSVLTLKFIVQFLDYPVALFQ